MLILLRIEADDLKLLLKLNVRESSVKLNCRKKIL